MKHTEYFKLQAKNLFKDYKTKTPYIDKIDGNTYFEYKPKYFDIDAILANYDYDETDFSLMKAQHIIALMAGFNKWADLVKASDIELELAKLLFDNQHKISIDEWEMYIARLGYDNKTFFEPEAQLEIFKAVFANEDGHSSMMPDYRLNIKKQAQEQLQSKDAMPEKYVYRELNGKLKQATIDKQRKAGLGFAPDTMIECIHCGDKFLFKEAKVIKLSSKYTHNPMEYIVCKNYPECDGDLIDFIPVNSKK